MPITFEEEAVRSQVWGRAFFMGPTGSGKSRGAFELATRLFGGELPVTYINSERDREKLYADRYKYSLINLAEGGDFGPSVWIKALDLAEAKNPGGVYILDSVSHEWMGEGGILQQADRFGDWKKARPLHAEFVQRILRCDAHVIAVCRAKMKYEVGEEEVNGRKKQTIAMLGVGPVQDGDLQYEFNLVGRFEQATHEVTFSGHVDPLIDTVTDMIAQGQTVADTYSRWLSEGEPMVPVEAAAEADVEALRASLLAEGIPSEKVEQGFAVARQASRGKLTPVYVAEKLAASADRIERKKAANEAAKKDTKSPADGSAPVAQETLTPA